MSFCTGSAAYRSAGGGRAGRCEEAAQAAPSLARLEGKVAIITGGASGIGEATAHLFVDNGALVVIADIQDEKGVELVDKLGPHRASYKHCDVSLDSNMEDLIAFTIQTFGKLDIMFNNAGVWGKTIAKDVRGMDLHDLDYVLSVNVRGMVLGVKHASRAMIDAKVEGSIICMASISSFLGDLSLPLAYTVSKHAILGLVRVAANDLGKFGIRVNCVSPTAVNTPLLTSYICEVASSASLSQQDTQELQSSLLKQSLTPLDVAKAVLYLASDDSTCVSGLNFVIDGGYSSIRVAM